MRFTLDPFDDLVRRCKLAPSREWMNLYFDLIKNVLEVSGLDSDDPRLVLSMPKSKLGFPMTIGRRYVLNCAFGKQKCVVDFIYGLADYELDQELQSLVGKFWYFTSGDHDNKASMTDPLLLQLKDGRELARLNDFSNGWLEATVAEVTRMTASPYRAKHQPVVYRAAIDLDYRESVLDAAFTAATTQGE